MVFRLTSRRLVVAASTLITLAFGLTVASAQAVSEEESSSSAPESYYAPPAEETHIGVALRLRRVMVPEGLIELFVADAPGGVGNWGIGAELSRRRGDFEIQFGLEYEGVTATPGLYVEDNRPIMGGYVDDVYDDGLGWITAELTFLYHTKLIDQLALRYGGGAGLGVVFGDVKRTDQICLTNSLDSCGDDPAAVNRDTPYNTPPVFPVVNAIIGLQIRPTREIFINVEGGIRTLPFFGATAGYYF